MVRGVEPQQNGVYQLVNDSNGNPQFFRHMDWGLNWTGLDENLIIHRKDEGWALSLGLSPETVTKTKVFFTSPSWAFGISAPVWKKGNITVAIMRVISVSNAFSKTGMMEGDWGKDEGIICQGDNNQRLFIEKTGGDLFYCDKKRHCPKTGMDVGVGDVHFS